MKMIKQLLHFFLKDVMGIETLYKYLHQYENASSKIKEVTEKLIEIEKELSQNIQNYL